MRTESIPDLARKVLGYPKFEARCKTLFFVHFRGSPSILIILYIECIKCFHLFFFFFFWGERATFHQTSVTNIFIRFWLYFLFSYIRDHARSLLQFLSMHCTEDAATYWLYKVIIWVYFILIWISLGHRILNIKKITYYLFRCLGSQLFNCTKLWIHHHLQIEPKQSNCTI